MIDVFITDLLSFQFLQLAVITSLIVGVVAGIIGSFIILRGMSLMGDAISHAVLPGVAISYMLGVHFYFGAIVFGILASIFITFISNNSIVKKDTAIGIILSAFLALGVILVNVARSSVDLFHVLFGNILAVQPEDLLIVSIVALIVILIVIIFYKGLLITSFDPVFAQSLGIHVGMYHYLLMILVTLVSVTAMQSVGTILIVSLLVTPAATAYLFTKKLSHMMIVSSLLAMASSLLGVFLGYSFNLSVGSTIVLVATTLFAVSFIIVSVINRVNARNIKNKQ